MKNSKYILMFLTLVLISACREIDFLSGPVGKKDVDFNQFITEKEQEPLAQIYYQHGNFINSKQFPPIVNASDVLDNLNNWLLIDIRKADAYEAGHINGAYNVSKDKVLDFIKNKQRASAYSKVAFICYTGQMASYVTGITRFSGFDNTYVMLFGMAGWNNQFSASLKTGYGTKYQDMIVKSTHKTATIVNQHEAEPGAHKTIDHSKLPKLPQKAPTVLMDEQAQKLLSQDRKAFLLKADEFFPDYKENSDKYLPLFYMSKDKYYVAHIKGAVFYQSKKDLSLDAKLADLPIDKDIVVYCKTGHTGGNAVAYLNMLGYQAKNLMFGSSSFMYDLWKKEGWNTDVSNLINDFPIISGEKRTNNK